MEELEGYIREELKIEDKSIIDKIEFIHPEIMNENSEEYIRKVHLEMINIQNQLYDYRKIVWDLEKELEKKKNEFDSLLKLCKIKYGYYIKNVYKDKFYSTFENTGDAYQRVINK